MRKRVDRGAAHREVRAHEGLQSKMEPCFTPMGIVELLVNESNGSRDLVLMGSKYVGAYQGVGQGEEISILLGSSI